MNRNGKNPVRIWFTAVCLVILASACNPNSGSSPADQASDGTSSSKGNDGSAGGEAFQHAVITDTLAYGEVDEQIVKGHFAFPEDKIGTSPAIILVHEWWGLNDEMRLLANQFAAEGFIVLAVDLFNGETADSAGAARKLMLKVFEQPELAEENLRQACDWALDIAGASQVAVVGYGFGGGWSLNAALAMPDQVDAAVMFYGRVSDNEEVLTTLEVPLLGFFGGEDSSIPAESVKKFETALKNLGKPGEVIIYPNAKGGFANPNNRNYYQNLAEISWRRMMEFLNHNLVTVQSNPA